MAIKLIASDMDGTLLDGKGSLDRERFGRLLAALEDREIAFVVASGNHISRLLSLFAGFEDRVSFVADNGAHLYEKGQTLYRHSFTAEQVAAVVSFYGDKAVDACLMLSNDDAIYMARGAGNPFDESLAIEEDQLQAFLDRIVHVEDLSAVAQQVPIYKMGLWVPEAQVDAEVAAFNQAFSGRLTAVTSGYGSIDLLADGIHKASGLEQVLTSLGLTFEQVMAFGDSDNDLEMLAAAGQGYAMDNATDKVKAVAAYRAPSHVDGGVFTIVEDYLAHF